MKFNILLVKIESYQSNKSKHLNEHIIYKLFNFLKNHWNVSFGLI